MLDNAEPEAVITLLCVHGNPSWSYLWRGLLAQPPAGARVIAIDHLDMGYSERTGTTRRLEQRIEDLCALTDELGIEGPVVTVAHDWGGPISLGWAQRNHDRLAGVVLANTAVHQPAGAAAPTIIRIARSAPLLETVAVRTSAFVRGAVEMSRRRPSPEVRAAYLAPYAEPARRAAVADFVADIPLQPDHPSAAVLDQVAVRLEELTDVPALLLWGPSDPVFSDLYLHDLEARLPLAETHRFVGARHYVPEEADVAGAVAAWVGQLGHESPASGDRIERAPFELNDGCAALEVEVGTGFGEPLLDIELNEPGIEPRAVDFGSTFVATDALTCLRRIRHR